MFRNLFIYVGLCSPDFVIFDLTFRFYMNYPPWNLLERSRIWNLGSKLQTYVFHQTFKKPDQWVILVPLVKLCV